MSECYALHGSQYEKFVIWGLAMIWYDIIQL
jgi:hypothetical protein